MTTISSVKWDDLDAAAAAVTGNWQSFDSFWWYDKPEDAHLWALLDHKHRDSDLLTESNAAATVKALEKVDPDGNDWAIVSMNHWAVGWLEHLMIRPRDAKTDEITPAFEVLCGLRERLEDYPVLDEYDWSNREYEAALEEIETIIKYDTELELEGDELATAVGDVYRELADPTPGYISVDDVQAALDELGYGDEDEAEQPVAPPYPEGNLTLFDL